MNGLRPQALDLAYEAVSYLQTLLERQGKLELVDGRLFAGGVALDNADALVKRVKAELGFGCTVFVGNVRIATTAVDPRGKLIVGTSASDTITQQVYRRGERYKGVAYIVGRNWVIVYVPLRDHQDKIIGMLAGFRELTAFLPDLTALDGTLEALILHRSDGRIVDVNRTACDMLALPRQELIGGSVHAFTVASEQAMQAAWAGIVDAPVRLESFWRRSDLFAFPVELLVSRSELPDSPLLLTVARDFTEQHAARQRLQALHAQLMQSEKMAALGKLVAGVTHDVNTPLGAIRSGNQTMASAVAKLRRAIEGEPAAGVTNGVARSMRVIEQTMETVAEGTGRINEVLRRLRSFARLDQGSLQDVDLRTCVEDVLTLVKHHVPEAVTVTQQLDELPLLRCYPAEVNQLIMNLVVNALDAVGDAGTITVRVSADDGHVELVVEDDGEGIAAPDLPNIFNPGFTTKGVGFGGGLGLAIAYQVAQLHNGSIEVESSQGAGARFTTRLPLMGVAAIQGDGI